MTTKKTFKFYNTKILLINTLNILVSIAKGYFLLTDINVLTLYDKSH